LNSSKFSLFLGCTVPPKRAEVELSRNSLGDVGACTLASSPHLDRLETLTLCGNYIGNAGIQALAACRDLSQLTHLDLSVNSIGDRGALALACGFPHLASLQFYGNHIGKKGRRVLQARFGDRVKLSEQ
jgi:hypothetical protein